MFIISGKYASAHVMANEVESAAIEQIQYLVDNEAAAGTKIAIMPDVHAGKGCTIGTVMQIEDRVVPNLVGVDIGCGVTAVRLQDGADLDFAKLQKVIEKYVPAGTAVHSTSKPEFDRYILPHLHCQLGQTDIDRAGKSLGTLGGGNHFISVEQGTTGVYLLVHTGSRAFGYKIASIYQTIAKEYHRLKGMPLAGDIIAQLKAEGRHQEIEGVLKELRAKVQAFDPELAYLEGDLKNMYLHDMQVAQNYANLNRLFIIRAICQHMGWEVQTTIETVHNYISDNILRKGAVAAYKDIPFVVPLNMKDGTLIFNPKEDRPDWLFSAPHGAGRKLSRTAAKSTLDLEDYRTSMEGIWTASVSASTLDEAPKAYKPADEIKEALIDVYDLVDHLTPLFNFKHQE